MKRFMRFDETKVFQMKQTFNKNANARTSHCMQKKEGLEYKIKTVETK